MTESITDQNISHLLDQEEEEDSEEELFQFYCPTCLLSFDNEEDYKAHYKTELHRFNSKRKMVNLPPVRPEEFEKRRQSKALSLKPLDLSPNFLKLALFKPFLQF